MARRQEAAESVCGLAPVQLGDSLVYSLSLRTCVCLFTYIRTDLDVRTLMNSNPEHSWKVADSRYKQLLWNSRLLFSEYISTSAVPRCASCRFIPDVSSLIIVIALSILLNRGRSRFPVHFVLLIIVSNVTCRPQGDECMHFILCATIFSKLVISSCKM